MREVSGFLIAAHAWWIGRPMFGLDRPPLPCAGGVSFPTRIGLIAFASGPWSFRRGLGETLFLRGPSLPTAERPLTQETAVGRRGDTPSCERWSVLTFGGCLSPARQRK